MIARHGNGEPKKVPQNNELLDAFSWRLLLPDFDNPRVLSISPPNIEHLDTLATLFGSVTSLESPASASVCDSVAKPGEPESISRIKGSVLSLPFSDESFELVIVNAVTDVRHGQTEEPAWQTDHQEILANLRRVLAPNGCVCLCTRNRWDYRALLAGAGENSGSPWKKLVGLVRTYRQLANLWLSPGQYATVLRNAGFSSVQRYVAFPDCKRPRFVVPFDAGVYRYYRRHFTYPEGSGLRRMAAKLVARSGLDRFLEGQMLVTGVKN